MPEYKIHKFPKTRIATIGGADMARFVNTLTKNIENGVNL
jgi:hypothetical protein